VRSETTIERRSPAANSPTVQAKQFPGLSVRLHNYRLAHDLTYAKLGSLCDLPAETVRRACLGYRLTERIAAKIQRLLESVNA
jgi:hypothetical protein